MHKQKIRQGEVREVWGGGGGLSVLQVSRKMLNVKSHRKNGKGSAS